MTKVQGTTGVKRGLRGENTEENECLARRTEVYAGHG